MSYDESPRGHEFDATDASGQYRAVAPPRAAPVGNLEDVFDDPAHGDVGRDRLGVHFAWEGVLAVAAAALGFLLFSNHRDQVSGESLQQLLVLGAALGFLTLGAGLTLRAGAPNLAIGTIAAASAIYYAETSERGVVPTAVVAVGAALVIGIVIAVLVVGFQVPGWAGSLAGVMIVVVWIQKHPLPTEVLGNFDPTDQALYLFGGFVALALIGGGLGVIKSVRRGLGRFRPVGDPALRRGGFAGTMTVLSLLASSAMAAVAGVLLASLDGAADRAVAPSLGLELTGIAIGAALVGGTSAFGRRGGVFGTMPAVTLLGMVIWYSRAADWKISMFAVAAGALALGLVVTRLVETFGRPLSIDESPDDWRDVGVPGAAATWSTGSGDTWSSLPAQPAPASRADQWGGTDDRWSSLR
jgi:ribose/xylose/arabinose/galactoside ABC-type transport system permease subunit